MRHALTRSLLVAFALTLTWLPAANAEDPEVQMFDIHQTVIKMALGDGISGDDAVDAMLSTAAELNMKMVKFNTIYAAYMPCRISLVEDGEGRLWLEMLNLDMIINAYPLPPELQAIAITINGTMLSILTAGATGSF